MFECFANSASALDVSSVHVMPNGTNSYGMIMYEVNEATQTHCYNSVAGVYPVWAYYVHR